MTNDELAKAELAFGLTSNLISVYRSTGFAFEMPIELADENAMKGLCGHGSKLVHLRDVRGGYRRIDAPVLDRAQFTFDCLKEGK